MSVLISGISHVFMGDDAFGCAVVRCLAQRPLPPEAIILDFGLPGSELGYALLEGHQAIILVDASPSGSKPGDLTLIELEPLADPSAPLDTPLPLTQPGNPFLQFAKNRKEGFPRLLLLTCEPANLNGEAGAVALSEPVAAVVEPAAACIQQLVEEILQERPA